MKIERNKDSLSPLEKFKIAMGDLGLSLRGYPDEVYHRLGILGSCLAEYHERRSNIPDMTIDEEEVLFERILSTNTAVINCTPSRRRKSVRQLIQRTGNFEILLFGVSALAKAEKYASLSQIRTDTTYLRETRRG